MKKILLLVVGGAILLISGLIFSKQTHHKECALDNEHLSPMPTYDANKKHPTPQHSVTMKQEVMSENNESITSNVEYMKIYNSIEGGTAEERTALATDAYKGGYRHNPDIDRPIVIQSNVSRRTGQPLLKFPASKMYRRYETDKEADEEFEKNLLKREQSYDSIEPAEGMISVQDAARVAMNACPVEFDAEQKPKVSLVRDFYLIFLWEHRRPYTDGTYHAASITVDAYSGEVRTVQIRKALKKPEATQ